MHVQPIFLSGRHVSVLQAVWVLLMFALLSAGCASTKEVSLVDIDIRTPTEDVIVTTHAGNQVIGRITYATADTIRVDVAGPGFRATQSIDVLTSDVLRIETVPSNNFASGVFGVALIGVIVAGILLVVAYSSYGPI